MITVIAKLVPYGDVNAEVILAHIQIFNDGTGTRDIGNYVIQVIDTKTQKPIKEIELKRFRRLDSNFCHLLVRVFKKLSPYFIVLRDKEKLEQ